MLSNTWNRVRFALWIILGGFGVILTYIATLYHSQNFGFEMTIFVWFLFLLFLLVLLLTYFGSRFSRIFLQKIAIIHLLLIWGILFLVYFWSRYFPLPWVMTSVVILFFLTPFIEEAVKHIASIWLIGKDFHFSQKDIASFTFFVVLGFVFAENLLYLISAKFSISTWIWRSFFTLIAHVFTALICAHYWWKALSYPLFSARYIGTFLFGFILAGGLHTLYNFLLEQGSIIGLIIYAVVGYVLVVVRKN